MEAFLEQDLRTVLSTILGPAVVVLGPIVYMMYSNRHMLVGESRQTSRIFFGCAWQKTCCAG